MMVRVERNNITTKSYYYKILKIKETKKNAYITVLTVLCTTMVNGYPESELFFPWKRAANNKGFKVKKEKELDQDLNEVYGWYVSNERLMEGLRIIKWDDIPELHRAHLLNPRMADAQV